VAFEAKNSFPSLSAEKKPSFFRVVFFLPESEGANEGQGGFELLLIISKPVIIALSEQTNPSLFAEKTSIAGTEKPKNEQLP
jgi:hypothetical protein